MEKIMNKTDPLLDDGMVALLQWLEQTDAINLKDIRKKCCETKGDHATVYKRKRSDDDWIEISHRDNPDNRSGRMILTADIYGDGWTITRDILLIGRRLLPQSSQVELCDPERLVDARSVIDHPYLTGAKTGQGERKPNLLLSVFREQATQVLTSSGIEKLT